MRSSSRCGSGMRSRSPTSSLDPRAETMTGEVPILRHDPADIDTVWALLDLENTANAADDPTAPPWGAHARQAGATYGLTDQRRTLDLATLAPGRLAKVREAAAKAAAGYSIVSWTGRTPDEYLTGVAAMYTAMNDAPARPGAEPDIWDE